MVSWYLLFNMNALDLDLKCICTFVDKCTFLHISLFTEYLWRDQYSVANFISIIYHGELVTPVQYERSWLLPSKSFCTFTEKCTFWTHFVRTVIVVGYVFTQNNSLKWWPRGYELLERAIIFHNLVGQIVCAGLSSPRSQCIQLQLWRNKSLIFQRQTNMRV